MSVSSRPQPAAPTPVPDRTAHLIDVRCPRCGYALRGEIESWIDQCPLDGRCTECGLPFAWVDVFTPDLFGPRWCVEFARRRRLPWSVVSTWVRSLWPWTFFRALRMTHEIKPRRIALFVVGLLVLGYLMVCLAQARLAYITWQGVTRPMPSVAQRTTVSAPRAVGQALLTPFSKKSLGSASYTYLRGGRTTVYPHPPPWNSARRYWAGLAYFLPMGLLMAMLQPAGFLALPISVRRAKVRPAHLVRVTIYSLSWLLLVVLVHGVAGAILGGGATMGRGPLIFLDLLFVPGFLMSWHGAIRCYLRMDHPRSVALAVTAMAGLLTAIILVQMYLLRAGDRLYG